MDGLAGDGGSSRSESVSEAVLRDEERPLVHERSTARMLEEAKGANPVGMMGAMMGGVMMMRGGIGVARIGGPPAEKPSTAEGAPSAGPQAQTQGSQPKPQGGGGGGFGSGSDDSRALEQITRIHNARMSAAISTLDKNPKNIAVIKKLEEPVALHFPMDPPWKRS